MSKDRIENRQGFIALISAIIISALLLVITFSISLAGYFARFDALYLDFKSQSAALANACGDIALIELSSGAPIAAPQSVDAAGDPCTIASATNGAPIAGESTIEALASVSGAVTRIKIVANTRTAAIISREEIP